MPTKQIKSSPNFGERNGLVRRGKRVLQPSAVDKDQMETLIVADSIRKARRFMRTGKEDRDV